MHGLHIAQCSPTLLQESDDQSTINRKIREMAELMDGSELDLMGISSTGISPQIISHIPPGKRLLHSNNLYTSSESDGTDIVINDNNPISLTGVGILIKSNLRVELVESEDPARMLGLIITLNDRLKVLVIEVVQCPSSSYDGVDQNVTNLDPVYMTQVNEHYKNLQAMIGECPDDKSEVILMGNFEVRWGVMQMLIISESSETGLLTIDRENLREMRYNEWSLTKFCAKNKLFPCDGLWHNALNETNSQECILKKKCSSQRLIDISDIEFKLKDCQNYDQKRENKHVNDDFLLKKVKLVVPPILHVAHWNMETAEGKRNMGNPVIKYNPCDAKFESLLDYMEEHNIDILGLSGTNILPIVELPDNKKKDRRVLKYTKNEKSFLLFLSNLKRVDRQETTDEKKCKEEQSAIEKEKNTKECKKNSKIPQVSEREKASPNADFEAINDDDEPVHKVERVAQEQTTNATAVGEEKDSEELEKNSESLKLPRHSSTDILEASRDSEKEVSSSATPEIEENTENLITKRPGVGLLLRLSSNVKGHEDVVDKSLDANRMVGMIVILQNESRILIIIAHERVKKSDTDLRVLLDNHKNLVDEIILIGDFNANNVELSKKSDSESQKSPKSEVSHELEDEELQRILENKRKEELIELIINPERIYSNKISQISDPRLLRPYHGNCLLLGHKQDTSLIGKELKLKIANFYVQQGIEIDVN